MLLGEVEVFDSEGEGFAHAHSGAVEELNEKAVCSVHLGDHGANLWSGEDNGKVGGLLGSEGLNIFERLVEDFSIEKNNGIEGLVLGGC